MASFPLRCNICPKNPSFSDVSHLLTHVGSKGHLSHYFKAQVRSRQELSYREQLLAYDRWYCENQIEKLLSQRMVLKESKKTNLKAHFTNKNVHAQKNARSKLASTRTPADILIAQVKDEDVIDPQLSQGLFLPDHTRTQESPMPFINRTPKCRHPIPRTKSWTPRESRSQEHSPMLTKRNQRHHRTTAREASLEDDEADTESAMDSPVRSVYPEPPRLTPNSPLLEESSLSVPIERQKIKIQAANGVANDEYEELDERISECTKLKGVCWPGMDLFDSASPDARRKRNQKKDGSVIEQMRANSKVVEPMELIFFPEGGLKQMREITGQVESSPIKEDTPKPKRQRACPRRAPLAAISSNAPRLDRKPLLRKLKAGFNKQQAKARPVIADHSFSERHVSLELDSAISDRSIKVGCDGSAAWKARQSDEEARRRLQFQAYGESPRPVHSRSASATCGVNHPFLNNILGYQQRLGSPCFDDDSQSALIVPYQLSNHWSTYGQSIRKLDDAYGSFCSQNASDQNEITSTAPDWMLRREVNLTEYDASRSTQRYFTMEQDHSAQFHTAVPSHMDFALFHGSRESGHCLNPLSVGFQQPIHSTFLEDQQLISGLAPSARGPYRQALNQQYSVRINSEDSGDDTIDESENDNPKLLDCHT